MKKEEALKQIREWDFLNEEEKEALATLIPELAEKVSEEEKIRREMADFVQLMKRKIADGMNGIAIRKEDDAMFDRWLAWLEKQKEQKPEHFELKAGKWYSCHSAFCCRADHLTVKEGERFMCEKDGVVKGFVIKEPEKYFIECSAPAPMEDEQEEQKPNIEHIQRSWYMEGYLTGKYGKEPRWIIKTDKGGPRYEDNPRCGKDKIKLKSVAHENDFMSKPKTSLEILKHYLVWATNDDSDCPYTWEQLANAIKDGIAALEQKPAEWSEEDELMRTVIIQTLERFAGRGTTGMQIEWLKSLCPQPKQEWSEEDEDKVDDICKLIEHATIIPRSGDDDTGIPPTRLNDKYKGELKAFVKSLRNCPTKSDTWKPSEEQMDALLSKLPVVKGGGDKIQDILESLYDELKQL